MKSSVAALIFFAALGTIGCNAVVDSPPQSPQPVTHIEDYYLPLKNVGVSYLYCRKSSSGADTISMTMQGNDASGVKLGNQFCYSTDLTKTNSYLNNYYYTMNDSEAYTLGKVSCGGTDEYWLDLKAPLMIGQSWEFKNTNGGNSAESDYTAYVTRRGGQMKMPDGKIYNDVAEIIYVSISDSTVKWFARGVGLIYSTSKTPNPDFGEEMWLVEQK
jgi:hypothetical protein